MLGFSVFISPPPLTLAVISMGADGGERHELYDHKHEHLDGFMAGLDRVLAVDPARTASVALLISKDDVLAGIDRARSRFDIGAPATRPDSTMFTIRLARKGDVPGRVLVAKAPGSFVHAAITDEPRPFVERTLSPFIRSLYPRVSMAFLSAGDLYNALESLERSAGGRVVAARTTAYGRLRAAEAEASHRGAGAGAVSRRGTPDRLTTTEAAVTYTNKPFREAFSAAAANDQWISRISFGLWGTSGAYMGGCFSRDGLFRFRHAIAPFYGKVFPLVARIVDKKTRLYSNRSRGDNNGEIRPLAITLDSAMAGDHSENPAFIKSMESMPHTSISVYHSNPYVHMSLVDYLDGSSFDIWVLSTRQILIVPQMRATHTSIARLTNRIFERFGEGRVTDHE